MQVKQSGTLIQATTRNLDAVGTAVSGTMGHLNTASDEIAGVAHTANGSLATLSTHTQTAIDTANSTLGTLDTAIATQNASFSKSQKDFQAVLEPIPAIEGDVKTDTGLFATTIGTTNHMLFTFDAVETKATHSYLHPPHGAAAIWPTIRPFLLPITQVGGAVAIEVAK
jgi:ABC-type transporter Mla subunit MlaD